MKITGNIWAKEINEEHPGSIKGQFTGRITYHEKRGKLKVSLTKEELLSLLLEDDSDIPQRFQEAVRDCDYDGLITEIEPSDIIIKIEVANA